MNNNPLLVCALEDEFRCNSRKFDLLYTGVGKINAAISMTEFLCKNPLPSYVINFGTAGSKKNPVGSLVDCTKFIQRDMDASVLGFEKYETPFEDKAFRVIEFSNFERNPIKTYSLCATGDSFIHNDSQHLLGDVFDMEAYAIAKICLKYKISFISFKYISDGAESGAEIEWNENVSNGTRVFTRDVLEPLNLV